jgi:glycosyltransferase involved in cell wall biosynthesis
MKKIVIVSPVVCFPAYSGNSVRIAQFVNALELSNVEVHFVLVPITEISTRKQDLMMEQHFGERFYQLTEGKLARGTFVNTCWSVLKKLGLNKISSQAHDLMLPWQLFNQAEINEFNSLISAISPDFVLAEYVLMAPLIDALPKDISTAVETHDCFTDRNKKIRESNGSGFWWSLTASQEHSLLSVFDHVIAIQDQEKQYFEKLMGHDANSVCKIDVLDVPEQMSSIKNKKPVIGFVGSDNAHNREGLQIFINIQWPVIKRALPDVTLHVAGDVGFDSSDDAIVKLGRVADLYDDFYSQCAFIINPCVSGSGLKIKTVEAMSYGLPVVATAEGIAGIESAIGQGLYQANLEQDGFAIACTNLLMDEHLRVNDGLLARGYIESAYQTSLKTIKALIG